MGGEDKGRGLPPLYLTSGYGPARDDYLERSASFDVLRDLPGLQSGDDIRRQSELFALGTHVLQLAQQLRQLDAQLGVVLLQLATLCRRRRVDVARPLTTQRSLPLLAMTLRLHHD